MGRQGETDLEALSKRCPNVPIDPDLLALVGIHPENPVQDDKALIREFYRAENNRLKIFIDVNVFIDVMTKRSGWTESLRVLNLARKSPAIDGWTSALTLFL